MCRVDNLGTYIGRAWYILWKKRTTVLCAFFVCVLTQTIAFVKHTRRPPMPMQKTESRWAPSNHVAPNLSAPTHAWSDAMPCEPSGGWRPVCACTPAIWAWVLCSGASIRAVPTRLDHLSNCSVKNVWHSKSKDIRKPSLPTNRIEAASRHPAPPTPS